MLVRSKKTMNKCNVMMFAAGLGTRLRPYTNTNPKPALPLLQIPLGYYSLPYLEKIEIDSFVVNTFHLAEQVHDLYSTINPAVQFSDETDFIKGSGGGLKQAEKIFNSHIPILTMNADEIFFTAETDFLNNALNTHSTNKNFATLIVTEHPEAGHKFGAIWCENNKVIHIGKDKPNDTAKPWHFIGLQFLSTEILNQIPQDQETNIFYDVLIHQLKSQNICIYPIKCDWYEVGNITDYQLAKAEIRKNLKMNSIYQKQFEKLQLLPKSDLSDLTE
jgi:NDP-sugar pyrophosphorylase family protein